MLKSGFRHVQGDNGSIEPYIKVNKFISDRNEMNKLQYIKLYGTIMELFI